MIISGVGDGVMQTANEGAGENKIFVMPLLNVLTTRAQEASKLANLVNTNLK